MNKEMKLDLKEKYIHLVTTLMAWDHAYYAMQKPTVDDAKYDAYLRELRTMEQKHPELIVPESPTQRVGGAISAGFKTAKHTVPMLSLYTETDFSEDGAKSFCDRILKLLPNASKPIAVVAEPKYDGLAISLRYENGLLVQALTRGQDGIGEDVTHTVKTIRNVPLRLLNEAPEVLEVRGEVMMLKSVFKRLNDRLQAQGERGFVNPRNAAAGSVRLLDTKEASNRSLSFYAYGLGEYSGWIGAPFDQWALLARLKDLGFTTSEHVALVQIPDHSALYRYHQLISSVRAELDYDIDGVVYKISDFALQEQLGSVSREPRWAVAHKYPPEEAYTRLLAITTEIGRTGKITPLAVLEPVYVGGVVVSNATLHNQFDLRKRGIRVGDIVQVRRAGDVIPEIVAFEGKREGYYPNWRAPKTCPSCGSAVVRKKGETNSTCTGGHKCPAQYLAHLFHFVSRGCYDIKGLGQSKIKELYEAGLLPTPAGFFLLTEEALKALKWGDKTIRNVLNSIASRKTVSLASFIYGLAIPNVGNTASKAFAERFGTLDNFLLADRAALESVPLVGGIIASSVLDWVSKRENIEQAYSLVLAGVVVEPHEIKPVRSNGLKGQVFVITGSFDGIGREELTARLLARGAIVSNSVNSKTNYLVAGQNPKSKLQKALVLGISVLTQDDVMKLI